MISQEQTRVVSERTTRVFAHSIYEQLRNEGYSARDMISVSSQLISLITAEMQAEGTRGC